MEARTHGDGHGAAAQHTVGHHTRIFLRPIGSPLPLGLLAPMCAGISGPFDTQLDRLDREAGVRNQL
jgi:hypothetical protein